MKRGISSWMSVLFVSFLVCSLAGCEHKELCYNHDAHVKQYKTWVDFEFQQEWEVSWSDGPDWKVELPDSFGLSYDSLRPNLPTGIRARVYGEDGDNEMYNLSLTGGKVQFKDSKDHALLFYNNDTEYIVFNELNHFATAQATTRARSRKTYSGNSVLAERAKAKEYTVGQPDMLFGSYLDVFVPKMEVEKDTLEVTMHPLTFTYVVRYEFSHGLRYVADTKGALAGMARTVFLNNGQTGREQATILYDCELKDFGAQALVKSFGIPNFPNPDYTRGEYLYGLTLEVTLKNGLHKNFDFDVTEQVAAQPQGGIIVVSGIEVPDDAGQAGGGGFDVDVNGWEGQENIELPLDSIK